MNPTSSKVELTISCINLVQLDTFSKSDPQAILYTRGKFVKDWTLVGSTEVIRDNKNPKFTKSFSMEYKFEERQELKVVILDIDNEKSTNINDQDYVGDMVVTLGDIVGSRGCSITKALDNASHRGRKNGHCCIRVEQIMDQAEEHWTFKLSCKGLEKKDLFGSSDPFIVISKLNQDNAYTPVYTSEIYKINLNPSFKEFTLPLTKLCGGYKNRPLRFEVYDWNRSGTHEMIGFVETQICLLNTQSSATMDIKCPKRNKKTGNLVFEKVSFVRESSFLEYLQGGCEISLIVAIDFTGSNGDPAKKDSLHYRSTKDVNDYQKAIMSVGQILDCYDYDHKYPVYGFGGFINARKTTSHCFACNFNDSNPEVFGVQGVLDVYNTCLDGIQLSGPTNFSQIIDQAAYLAQGGGQSKYSVLLIMTDGEITDMEKTVESIVKASVLPLSIIIVGVGDEKFVNMSILDGDDRTLSSQGRKAARDIVQFVPFSKFKKGPIESLAGEVLKEIPSQVVKFMMMNKFQPRQRVFVDPFNGIPQEQQQNQQMEQPLDLSGGFIVTPSDPSVVSHIVVDSWQSSQTKQ